MKMVITKERKEKMMGKEKLLVVLLAWILAFAAAQAGLADEATEETDRTYELEEVVVTATKTEREIGKVPASISVIKAEDIEGTATVTLDDAFRYTPGIKVTRGEGMGTCHTFMSIRGMRSGHNLVYVDGVNMVESLGGGVNLSFLPTEDIEKVEILRGASSALYGGRAMGGVVNIFSKKPEDGLHSSLKPEYGTYDYEKYVLKTSYGWEEFGFSLSYVNKSIGNFWTRDEMLAKDYDYRTGISTYYDTDEEQGHKGWENWNHDYEEWNIRPKLFYEGDSTKLTLSMGMMDNETGLGYTTKYQNVDGASDIEKNLEKSKVFAGLLGETKLDKDTTLSYRVNYHNPERKSYGENMDLTIPLTDQPLAGSSYSPSPVFLRSITEDGSKDYELETRLTKPLSESHIVTAGVEYIRNDASYEIKEEGTEKALTNSMDKDVDFYSIYLQDEWQVTDPLLLTLGIRGDFFSDFDDQVSPKAAFLYDIADKTQVFGSVATAYNPPSIRQTFGPDWNMGTYILRVSNPDLEPEESISYETGIRHAFTENFRVGLSGFWTEAENLITSVQERRQVGSTTSAGKSCYITYEYSDNVEEARMAGVEVETSLKLGKNQRIFANYTLLDTLNKTTDEQLERLPKHLGSVGYSFNYKPDEKFNYRASARVRASDKMWMSQWGAGDNLWSDGFFVADLSLGVDIMDSSEIFLNVTNLFDEDYKEFTYARYQRGRQIWGGVKFYF